MEKLILGRSCTAPLFLEKTFAILDVKLPPFRIPTTEISYHGTRTEPSSGSSTARPSAPPCSPGTSNTKRYKALWGRCVFIYPAQHLRIQKSQKIDFPKFLQTPELSEDQPVAHEVHQKKSKIKKERVDPALLRGWGGELRRQPQWEKVEGSDSPDYQLVMLSVGSEREEGGGWCVFPFRVERGLLPAQRVPDRPPGLRVGRPDLLSGRLMLYFNIIAGTIP